MNYQKDLKLTKSVSQMEPPRSKRVAPRPQVPQTLAIKDGQSQHDSLNIGIHKSIASMRASKMYDKVAKSKMLIQQSSSVSAPE